MNIHSQNLKKMFKATVSFNKELILSEYNLTKYKRDVLIELSAGSLPNSKRSARLETHSLS